MIRFEFDNPKFYALSSLTIRQVTCMSSRNQTQYIHKNSLIVIFQSTRLISHWSVTENNKSYMNRLTSLLVLRLAKIQNANILSDIMRYIFDYPAGFTFFVLNLIKCSANPTQLRRRCLKIKEIATYMSSKIFRKLIDCWTMRLLQWCPQVNFLWKIRIDVETITFWASYKKWKYHGLLILHVH